VHPGQPVAPGRESHPEATDHDHGFDAEKSEKSRSALVLVRPESERYAQREHEDQTRSCPEPGRALLGTFLHAAFFLALHLLEGRRRLGWKSLELPFYFL